MFLHKRNMLKRSCHENNMEHASSKNNLKHASMSLASSRSEKHTPMSVIQSMETNVFLISHLMYV